MKAASGEDCMVRRASERGRAHQDLWKSSLTLAVYIQDMASIWFDSVFNKKTQDVEAEKRETMGGGGNQQESKGRRWIGGGSIMKMPQ